MTANPDDPATIYAQLGLILDESAALDADVAELLEKGWTTDSLRQAICSAYCKAALEHSVSQRALLSGSLNGTALALIRLHFETVVRAAWIDIGATEKWLTDFSTPVLDGDLTEPILGPPIPSMIATIFLSQPELALELRKLNDTVKVMHSFVHGGVHLVAHALRGYPPTNLVHLLRNRNLLNMQLCMVIVRNSRNIELTGAVPRLLKRHSNCLPARV